MRKRVQTVNKHKPRVEFTLWASNEKGYCPVGNREIIGICNARNIVRKTLKLNAAQTELVLDKLYDEGKYLVFGKNVNTYFDTKVAKVPNVFFLGGVQ